MMRACHIFPVLVAGLLSAFSLHAVPAAAQSLPNLPMGGDNSPAMMVKNTEDLSVNFNDSFNAIDNPYLSDSMKLNYQINLLQKLTERQAELLKISDSFNAMGIPFHEPPPARGLCAQLPANAPCLKYYPELYSDVVNERKAYYDTIRAQAMAANPEAIPTDTTDPQAVERARKAREDKEKRMAAEKTRLAAAERASRYQWSEVSCVAGQCQGVMIAPSINGFRTTVREGSRLADGTRVEAISTRGIRVVIEGDRIDLRPAATEVTGGTATQASTAMDMFVPDTMGNASSAAAAIAAAATSGVTGISITNVNEAGASGVPAPAVAGGASDPAASAAQGTTAAPAASAGGASGTSMVQPALGPSGLF